MAAPRVFVAHTTFLPSKWIEATGTRPHISQGSVAVFANSKADVRARLAEVGLRPTSAEGIAKAVRMRYQRQWSTDVNALIEAGMCTPGDRRVLTWADIGGNGPFIVEVGTGGTLTVVGRVRYDANLRKRIYERIAA